jgi:hypothetical protein
MNEKTVALLLACQVCDYPWGRACGLAKCVYDPTDKGDYDPSDKGQDRPDESTNSLAQQTSEELVMN